MKSPLLTNSARAVFVACLLTAASAIAGPGPQVMFAPVKAKEVASIKPGTRLAVSCGNCGAVISIPADEKRSYEKGFVCPSCKAKFVRRDIGGHGSSIATYTYFDNQGHQATLLRAM